MLVLWLSLLRVTQIYPTFCVDVGEIIEGKREKKKVERLVQSVQLAKPKERLKVESGEYHNINVKTASRVLLMVRSYPEDMDIEIMVLLSLIKIKVMVINWGKLHESTTTLER